MLLLILLFTLGLVVGVELFVDVVPMVTLPILIKYFR